MLNHPEIYIPFIYIIAAIPFALLGLYAWRKRPAVAVNPFAWAALCMSIWSFTYGLEILAPDLRNKLIVMNFEYLGIVGVSVFLFIFALEYTGKSSMLTPVTRHLLWGIPVLTVLLVWTNPYPNSVVIETGKPYRLSDTWEAFEEFRKPPHDHIRSWLGVPLIVQNKTIGLLSIDSEKPNNFTEADTNIAMEFANQVAITLENARIFGITQSQALTDALTGIHNRRGLFQLGEFEFERARRILRPFSALMFDIDHFKKINDTHGHAIGDQVLHQLAERCRKNSRAIDLIARYGGEEFTILLPETNLESTYLIAKRLHQTIINVPITTSVGELSITISIGVAEADLDDTLNTLIEKADKALYQAKHSGRNRIVIHRNS